MIKVTIFIAALSISIIIALYFFSINNWRQAFEIELTIGLISWLLAGLFSGFFISGDRTRANNSIETSEDRKTRKKYSNYLFFLGLPFLLISLIIYLLL